MLTTCTLPVRYLLLMIQKVRLTQVITRLIVGGAQETAIETCKYINSSRFDAGIISGPQTGPEGELISAVQKSDIPLTIIDELVREPAWKKDFAALGKLIRLFRASKPHIVHTNSSKAGILGRWAAKFANVPVIVHTVHGWGHTTHKTALSRMLFTFLERATAPITDRLIVVSHLNAERGLQDGIGKKDQYITIHSSIDLDPFLQCPGDSRPLKQNLGINPDALLVGTVGRLSKQKNPLDFVRVAEQVKKHVPEAQFIFVGDGPLRAETEQLVAQSNFSQDVFLPGIRNDIPALLNCMDVFIMTSLWEGLPRVIPQAMATGRPVVANAVDGVCEIIQEGENGFLIPPRDTSLMAQRIVRLLQDASQRKKMGETGRRTATTGFSVWDMISRLETLYEELLTEKAVIV